MPSRLKLSMEASPLFVMSWRHLSMNCSRGVVAMLMPNTFSACTSIGSPFLSRPRGKSTLNPAMRLYRAMMSMMTYVNAWPMCTGVFTYGGGVSMEKVGRLSFLSNA
ncbi:MAG: hypothetical protein NT016_01675 [Candidatus Aenigmarchaeota archaeon]|nr:hypothetical protein [Candidatus Aenigmarchaeota archaeon]